MAKRLNMESFIKFSVLGVHCWANAPQHFDILRNLHLHTFNVEVRFDQPFDRGIEFLDFCRIAKAHFKGLASGRHTHTGAHDFGTRSCETLATQLGASLLKRFGNMLPRVTVTVTEDDMAGSTVYMRQGGEHEREETEGD